MKPYDRLEWKRSATHETLIGLDEERPAAARRIGGHTPEAAPAWTRGIEAFGEAVERAGQTKLAPVAWCGRFQLVRTYRCGGQQPLIEGWCGSPYCPTCAGQRAAAAIRWARQRWLGLRVAVVFVPTGRPGGLGLPSASAVASVRAAWGAVTQEVAERTGLERLEAIPRAVVGPDGLTFFARVPELGPGDEGRLGAALAAAARAAGLRDVDAAVLSREAAIMRYYRALLQESERFAANVAADLDRLEGFPWDVPSHERIGLEVAARRWTELAAARHADLRRQTVVGSKDALPAGPVKPRVFTRGPRPCPAHGQACRADGLTVRDQARGGRAVWSSHASPFGERPTRQQLTRFFERVRDEARQAEAARPRIVYPRF